MSRKIKRQDCDGCYNEDYHHGLGGSKKCWSFDDAEMEKGRKQSIHTLPKHYRGRWVLIPRCWTRPQMFVERLAGK